MRKFLSLLPVGLALSAGSLCAQTQITIPQSYANISWTNIGGTGTPSTEGNRDTFNMINNSGMTLGSTYTHAKGDNGISSNLLQGTGGLLIDFGSPVSLGTMQIWAWNYPYGNFSPNTFDFYYSTDSSAVTMSSGHIQVANLGGFTQLTNDTPLAAGLTDNGYVGETYSFGSGQTASQLSDYSGGRQSLSATPITARYVFLNDMSGQPSRLGFAEIQFYTYAASAIPEPSTYAALVGSAVLGLAFWRRRKAAAQ